MVGMWGLRTPTIATLCTVVKQCCLSVPFGRRAVFCPRPCPKALRRSIVRFLTSGCYMLSTCSLLYNMEEIMPFEIMAAIIVIPLKLWLIYLLGKYICKLIENIARNIHKIKLLGRGIRILMQHKTNALIGLWVIAILALGIFPPWIGFQGEPAGHSFLLTRPHWGQNVDYSKLLLMWFVISLVFAPIAYLLRSKGDK